ncbi:kelch repeat-containing protein [Viridothelium virens]|uniref:Kelch repeat-containing protein n=1 Tax=Viridothelium virens TaxID=1048519 RepID=A0A6A6HHI3_VIRVR|nr:kelch repeat-containing protein [Viridothelium virens]
MVKKDKKTKAAEKKIRVAQKQDKKAAQKEKKAKTKSKDDDSEAEDVDLDTVLAEYARQQEQFLKVTETPSEPPSARSSSALIASPSNDNELFLFGGESFVESIARFYNDLFVYNIKNDTWRLVTSPNSPLPRSGHAWCRGGNTGGIYLFGGEFSSPKQGTFYHYNDFWYLDPSSREWTKLETKGKGPPARSGHRMTYFKNYIILFGGFQDTSQQTKYLQDVWLYDCREQIWHCPTLSQKPDARSSFSLLPHDSGAVLYGGYSRVKITKTSGNQKKGSGLASRIVMSPKVHEDTWFLRVTQLDATSPANSPPIVRWERRKKPANSPNPPRAGVQMTYHRGRGVCFGGVHDVEQTEEGMESEFFNDLFAWNVDRNRFFQLNLRKPRRQTKAAPVVNRGRRQRGKVAEEELLRNLAALETKGAVSEMDMDEVDVMNGKEEEDADKQQKTVSFEMPHIRFNAALTVQDDMLYIFGGTFEKGDAEYTFDEMLSIDLDKLDGVTEIYKRDLPEWQGSEDEDSDEDDEENEDEDMEDEDDAQEDEASAIPRTPTESSVTEESTTPSMTEEDPIDSSALTDSKPHPRPFESLKDFFARTSLQWQEILLSDALRDRENQEKSVKEIKKDAFELAKEKFWDCREEIRALEIEQEEAGIGEVVSVTERGEQGKSRR